MLAPVKAIFLLIVFADSTLAKLPTHLHSYLPSTSCVVLVYGDLDRSETAYIFQVLLQQSGKCGCHLKWRKRAEFSALREGIQQDVISIILIGNFGPSISEQEILQSAPGIEIVTILHFSDEMLQSTNPSIYGKARQTLRNYYHQDMGQQSIDYLLEKSAPPPPHTAPKVLWMPLGLATLMPLPSSFTYRFLDRPLLWSWAGSTENKLERSEMLTALKEDQDADHIAKRGKLHSFTEFAGIGQSVSPESWNSWEYSMVLQQTQFVPAPAGVSAEQYRIWESMEAGCIVILLQQHVEPGAVLYPLHFLGFKFVNLTSWAELPRTLLQLEKDLTRRPQYYEAWQDHNNKLWAHLKTRLQEQILHGICGGDARHHSEGSADKKAVRQSSSSKIFQ